MAAIVMAESSGRPGVINNNPKSGDNSYGLAQVNTFGPLAHRSELAGIKDFNQLLDPQTNLNVAKKIKDSSGWGAWSTYGTQSFKQALGQVQKAAGEPASPLPTSANPTTTTNPNQQNSSGNTYNFYVSGNNQDAQDFLTSWLPKLTGQTSEIKSSFNPLALLQSAFSGKENEFG